MKYKLKRPLPRASVGTIWDMLLGGKEILMKEDNNDLQELFPSATFSDWFEEVDERWKPEELEVYYFCFKTAEEAQRAAEQIKALLKEFHKNNP